MKKKTKTKTKKIKKPTQKQNKKKLMDLVFGLAPMFSVNMLDIEYRWMKEDDNKDLCADITYDEPYQRITIRVYPVFFSLDLREQRKAILHEMCHIITLPSKLQANQLANGKIVTEQSSTDTNEKQTSQIENILDMLMTAKTTKAKTAYDNFLK